MPPTGYFIDANLLILFVVGSVGREFISKHRWLRHFTEEHYDLLITLINEVQVFVTPNTLTETSNLLAQHAEPERSVFFNQFRAIIQVSHEIVVASEVASCRSEFGRLGLTDTALLEVITKETPLLTVDFDLYRTALTINPSAAVNFWHLWDL